MSDSNRTQALVAALQTGGDCATVLTNAACYLAFLNDSTAPTEAPKAAKAEKADKPAKVEKAAKAAPPVEEAAAPEETGPTEEEVKGLINELLQANLRKQTIDLLGEFKAKNASGIPAAKRASFIEKANALLLAA
jgi:hypothetical protein